MFRSAESESEIWKISSDSEQETQTWIGNWKLVSDAVVGATWIEDFSCYTFINDADQRTMDDSYSVWETRNVFNTFTWLDWILLRPLIFFGHSVTKRWLARLTCEDILNV